MDGVNIIRAKAQLFPRQIEHLPADHAAFSRALRKKRHGFPDPLRRKLCTRQLPERRR